MSYLFLLSCAVLFFVPLYFVVNQVYQDGVVGRGSLLAISFCAGGFLLEAAFGGPFYIHPLAICLVTSFAVFITWHLARFHFRVLKKEGQWKQTPSLKT